MTPRFAIKILSVSFIEMEMLCDKKIQLGFAELLASIDHALNHSVPDTNFYFGWIEAAAWII